MKHLSFVIVYDGNTCVILQDFDHVQMLEERFERFSEETKNIGSDRLQIVNAIADQLIGGGHGDAVHIGEFKGRVNGAWEDLLELLVTRKEVRDFVLFSDFPLRGFRGWENLRWERESPDFSVGTQPPTTQTVFAMESTCKLSLSPKQPLVREGGKSQIMYAPGRSHLPFACALLSLVI